MTRAIRILSLLLLATLAVSCSDDAITAEEEIRLFIERGVAASENRDLDELSELLHPDYRDQKGYNSKQIGQLLRAYFFRHKNIHLFTRIDRINLVSDHEAEVSLHVAMAASVISDIDALSRLAARLYRFELSLVRQDEWLLRHASWENAVISELH